MTALIEDSSRDDQPVGQDAEHPRLRLDSLTGLRAFAAITVMLHHGTREYTTVPWLSQFFNLASVGVSFFFILSGFVLMWSRRPAESKGVFYWNRFARVYPLHAIVWLWTVVVIIGVGELFPDHWQIALATLLLVQAWIPSRDFTFGVNGVSWSLSCEMFFYAVFPFAAPVMARLRNRGLLIALAIGGTIWVAVNVIVHRQVGPSQSFTVMYAAPWFRIPEFLLGMGLAVAMRNGWRPRISVSAAGVLVLLSYVFATYLDALSLARNNQVAPTSLTYGFPTDSIVLVMAPSLALLIVAAARSDLVENPSWLRSKAFITLGQWSFAFYLTHFALIFWLGSFIPDDLGAIGAVAALLLAFVVCFAVAGALYTFLERPIEGFLRHKFSGRPTTDGRLGGIGKPGTGRHRRSSVDA